jgi:hypothetical protein
MKYRKFNKYEKKEVRAEAIQSALAGAGMYLFRNNTNADLTLPRPTKSGLRSVGPKQEFQGDNYYMQFVKTGLLRLVKEIQSPVQPVASEVIVEQKLILDQPETVTHQGKVEHVVVGNQPGVPAQKLNEQKAKGLPLPDVLINESPVEGGFVIVQ